MNLGFKRGSDVWIISQCGELERKRRKQGEKRRKVVKEKRIEKKKKKRREKEEKKRQGNQNRTKQNKTKHKQLTHFFLPLLPLKTRIVHPKSKYMDTVGGSVMLANTEAKKVRFFDREVRRVFLHPSSFNFVTPSFPSPFLVFLRKMQTDKTYLMDSAMFFFFLPHAFFYLFLTLFFLSFRVSPLLLFFSSGNVHVLHENSTVIVDDWICMTSSGRVGVLLNELRSFVLFISLPFLPFLFLPFGTHILSLPQSQEGTKLGIGRKTERSKI